MLIRLCVVAMLLGAFLPFVPQPSQAQTASDRSFQIGADWGANERHLDTRKRRTGADRDRPNDLDARPGARDAIKSNQAAAASTATNILSGLACLNNPNCGSIWIPGGRFDSETDALHQQIKSTLRTLDTLDSETVKASVASLHTDLVALSASVSDYLEAYGSHLSVDVKADIKRHLDTLNSEISGGYSALQSAVIWVIEQSVGSLDVMIQDIKAFRGE